MTRKRPSVEWMATALLVIASVASAQQPAGTAFTYQGQLKQAGGPVNGAADFEFALWDAATEGATVGAVDPHPGVDVVSGLFTVQLDFGSNAFTGDARWVEVEVTYPVGGTPVTLSPRQPITPAPYALHALNGGADSPWTESGSNIFYNTGNVGIGTNNPSSPLHIEKASYRTVYARNTTPSGTAYGGYFQCITPGGYALFGQSTATSVRSHGVYGTSQSTEGVGARGAATSATGATRGVWGSATSNDGHAGYFEGRGYFSGNVGIGEANPNAKLHIGGTPNVDGIMFPDGTLQTTAAVSGDSLWTLVQPGHISYDGDVSIGTDNTTASLKVFTEEGPAITASVAGEVGDGIVVSTVGVGARAIAATASGEESHALDATATNTDGIAIIASARGTNGTGIHVTSSGANGVTILANARTDTQVAIEANATGTATLNEYPLPNAAGKFYASGQNGVGVLGRTDGSSGYGVHGKAEGQSGRGIFGEANASNGYGVYGANSATGGSAFGVYGSTASPTGYSGYFNGGKGYFSGRLGLGTINPQAKLHIYGAPGVDGLMFPDGTLQTTAALGGGGGGDGHSLDAADGNPVDALAVDNNGTVTVLSDLNAGDELIAEGEVTLNDPNSGTDLVSLNRNGDGHGQLVTFADGSSVASTVVGTDTDANGAGGLVLLSFDDALGPAVKLDSTGNAGRATLARSTGPLALDETVVMYANAPRTDVPASLTGGGGVDILNGNGVRTIALRGDDGLSGDGGLIQGFDSSGSLVFELDTEISSGAPNMMLEHPSGGNQSRLFSTVDSGGRIDFRNAAGATTITIDSDDGNGADGDGVITTQILAITGGSDLSENFDIRSPDGEVKPGMVVCIDPDRPGKLVVSHRPYDRTVAGVISGAGGVVPGMRMGQKGSVADGDHPVALTGRTYVFADASSGPIRPGDLMTTSDTPGHAMKVTRHAEATGAVLGKAMTSLDSGQGLVLILIALH